MRALVSLIVTLPAALLIWAAPLASQDFRLAAPIDCSSIGGCPIQNFVDLDPGPAAKDFTCGPMTYDGHRGTDFGLPTLDMIDRDIPVLAAASGRVTGLRDGMVDARADLPDAPDITGRQCGNGVVIDHGDGWETQYCHLRQGSVQVQPEEQVDEGDVIGFVGYSGQAEFAHLHISVRKDGEVIDPFDPDGAVTCGDPSQTTLWQDPPDVRTGGILMTGFSEAIPEFDAIRSGSADDTVPTESSPGLVFWAYAFGGREGDRVEIELRGPDGFAATSETVLERDRAIFFRATGKRRRADRWAAGDYRASATLSRGGDVLDSREDRLTLP